MQEAWFQNLKIEKGKGRSPRVRALGLTCNTTREERRESSCGPVCPSLPFLRACGVVLLLSVPAVALAAHRPRGLGLDRLGLSPLGGDAGCRSGKLLGAGCGAPSPALQGSWGAPWLLASTPGLAVWRSWGPYPGLEHQASTPPPLEPPQPSFHVHPRNPRVVVTNSSARAQEGSLSPDCHPQLEAQLELRKPNFS